MKCVYKLCSLEPRDGVSQASPCRGRALVKMQVPWPRIRDPESADQYGAGGLCTYLRSISGYSVTDERQKTLKSFGLAGWQFLQGGCWWVVRRQDPWVRAKVPQLSVTQNDVLRSLLYIGFSSKITFEGELHGLSTIIKKKN